MMAHKYGNTPEYEHLPHKAIRTNRLTIILNWLLVQRTIIGASGK